MPARLRAHTALRVSRQLPLALAFALGSGCGRESPTAPADAAPVALALELSSRDAAPGSRIAVAVAADLEGRPLQALQGALRFDPARLRYAGQPEGGPLLFAGEPTADGRLALVATDVRALPRRAVTLVFEVRQPGYAEALGFDLVEAVSAGDAIHRGAPASAARVRDDLAVPASARILGLADWPALLAAHGVPERPDGPRVALIPGQGAIYGDMNASGAVTSGDVALIANLTVGNIPLLDGAPNRDGVIAANVRPINAADGVTIGANDPCRPGVDCTTAAPFRETGPGSITAADLLAVQQFLVGNAPPVVGQVIPGRAPATAVVVVSGSLTNGATWTADTVYRLSGIVRVPAGITLTIAPGTRIEAGAGGALRVETSGSLLAEGTALQPIVFTCASASPAPGCWTGIELLGGLVDGQRRVRYVRIEFATDGLRLEGGGDVNTTIDYLQVHRSSNAGVRSTTGTVVSLRHAVLTANPTGILVEESWLGVGQFLIIQQDPATHRAAIDLGWTSNNTQLFNTTIVAPAATGASPPAPPIAIRLRGDQSHGITIANSIVFRPSLVVDIDGDNHCPGIANGTPSLRNLLIAGASALGDPDTSDPDPNCAGLGYQGGGAFETSWLQDPRWQHQFVNDPAQVEALLVRPDDPSVPDFRPRAGSLATTMALQPTPPTLFEPAPYAGAVAPATAITQNNLPWYSGWTVPSPTTPPPPAGMISGSLERSTGGGLGGVTLQLEQAGLTVGTTVTAASGAFSFSTAPAGPAVVRVVSGLPSGCIQPVVDVNVGAGAGSTLPLRADCTPPTALVRGRFHTCALRTDGAAFCWGANTFGQLGDGTQLGRVLPASVIGGLTFTSLAAGEVHTCGLTAAGAAYCWGLNSSGQLGIASIANQNQPVAVASGATRFARLSAGSAATCGLTADGVAWCWGDNNSFRVGDGSSGGIRATPVRVTSPVPLVQLAAGGAHACALANSGSVLCWGDNGVGQLGDGSQLARDVPTQALSGQTFRAVSSGALHSCALAAGGAAFCWGDNSLGELGVGSPMGAVQRVPAPVLGGRAFADITAAREHTCALESTGAAWCWGVNRRGALGAVTATGEASFTPSSPVAVAGGFGFTALAVGSTAEHVCGLTSAGLRCWGRALEGQLGSILQLSAPLGVSIPRPANVFPEGRPMLSVAAGGLHSCGIGADQRLLCWGLNPEGRLGFGPTPSPSIVPAGTSPLALQSVVSGGSHSCGIAPGGAAYCWGANDFGQLGTGSLTPTAQPTAVQGGLTFRALSAGGAHTCGVTTGDMAFCWGRNAEGQLGDGSSDGRAVPVAVLGAPSTARVAAGGSHTCLVALNGQVSCWGSNTVGQLGDGTTAPRSAPAPIAGGASYLRIAAGAAFTCAVTVAGQAECWGVGSRLGNGQTAGSSIPVAVSGGLVVTDVTAGDNHACVLASTGEASCWGNNVHGQLGVIAPLPTAPAPQALSPLPVAGTARYATLSAGGQHTCALTIDGFARCWGNSGFGAIGNGYLPSGLTAAAVPQPAFRLPGEAPRVSRRSSTR